MTSRPAIAVLTLALVAGTAAAGSATTPERSSGDALPAPPAATALIAPGCRVALGSGALSGPGCADLPQGSGAAPAAGLRATVAAPSTPAAVVAPAPEPCLPGVPRVDDRCESSTGGYDGGAGDLPGNGFGSGEVIISSPDGATSYTAATSRLSADNADLVTLAQDAVSGANRWEARVPSVGGLTDLTALAVTADPLGTAVYSAVTAYDGDCESGGVVAHDAATGSVLWTSVHRAPGDNCLSIRAFEVDPAGRRLFVIGSRTHEDGVIRAFTTAHDTTDGRVLWSHESDGGFKAGIRATALTVADGGATVYVASGGLRPGSSGPQTFAWTLTAFDAVTGVARPAGQWVAPKLDAFAPANPPAAVQVTPNGTRAVVTGGAAGITLFDVFTVAFDTTTGAIAWQTAYEGPRGKLVKSSFDSVWYHRPLGLSPDGRRAYIAGYSTSLHGANLSMDFVTLAYDVATGANLWAVPRITDEWINWVPSISVAPDGMRVYLSGQSRHFQLLTAHYETVAQNTADGSVAWVGRYADGLAYWSGAALSPDGKRLFVTGSRVPRGANANSGASYEVATVAYPAD